MLKVRVIPTILSRNGLTVKGIGFDSWRQVSSSMESIRVYAMREVDELVFLDIAATIEGRPPNLELIEELSDFCSVPLSVGGGIRTVGQASDLLRVGADRVVVNSAAFADPTLLARIADTGGQQAVIASIDAKPGGDGQYYAWCRSGSEPTGTTAVDLAKLYEQHGAGEILLTSIPRDGTMEGYDLQMIAEVSAAVSIPVIASGGAGNFEDMYQAITVANAAAVCAGAMYQFTRQTPREAKEYLASKDIPVRF